MDRGDRKRMLKIQEFLNCFDDISVGLLYLNRNLGINSTLYATNVNEEIHNVYLLRPGLRADMSNPLVREAHCLILHQDGDLAAKAWTFPEIITSDRDLPKDFKLPSGIAAEEMPDGKIIIVYNIEGKWIIGTSNSINGKEQTERSGEFGVAFTYEEKINNLIKYKYQKTFKDLEIFDGRSPDLCFIFNYVSMYNNCIMPAGTIPTLYLMGIMDIKTGIEIPSDTVDTVAHSIGFSRQITSTVVYTGASFNKCLAMIRTLSPGLMLRQYNRRLFVPNPIYIAVKHAVEAGARVTSRHMVRIIQKCRSKDDVSDVVSAYPNFKSMLELLWKINSNTWTELVLLWDANKTKPTMKDFARAVKQHPLNYLLFMFRDKKITSFKAELDKLEPSRLISIARNKHEEEYNESRKLLLHSGGDKND